jgi:hypothetical protein
MSKNNRTTSLCPCVRQREMMLVWFVIRRYSVLQSDKKKRWERRTWVTMKVNDYEWRPSSVHPQKHEIAKPNKKNKHNSNNNNNHAYQWYLHALHAVIMNNGKCCFCGRMIAAVWLPVAAIARWLPRLAIVTFFMLLKSAASNCIQFCSNIMHDVGYAWREDSCILLYTVMKLT